MYTENDYLMWLSCIINIGTDKKNCLLDYFGEAKEIWNADRDEILNVLKNIKEECLHTMFKTKDEKLMEKRIYELERVGIKFIGVSEDNYPEKLKEIYQPPIGLYVLGEFPDFSVPSVNIVGMRKRSIYGADVTYKLAKELAENGFIIISGMAEGVDSDAHRGALDGNGITAAVLGNGVDICYPEFNGKLRERIIENGCLISEYPPGTKPKPYLFPIRNRIMSGLSDVVVVTEAKERSGSLITVSHALEQGKDVFAVPGNITSDRSEGTNELLKQGAYVLTKTEDILEVFGIEQGEDNKINNKKITQTLETDEKLVYDCICSDPISVDELFIKTGKNLSNLQYILTMLEIKGVIRKISGQKYIRSY